MKPERPIAQFRKPKAPPPPSVENSAVKDPVQVYCRIKPSIDNSSLCVTPFDLKTVKLTPPENCFAFRNGTGKEQLYKFEQVFTGNTSQKDTFDTCAKPLISNLLLGKNCLLFAYGITGSGKTYTIQGTPQDGGIIRRSIDVVFNSITECQAKKYIFKPNRLNGFDVQSEADALLDRQRLDSVPSYYGKTPRRFVRRPEGSSSQSDVVSDSSKVSTIEDDSLYSIFVTYIEMYNNYTYDLLEEFAQNNMIRDLQSKLIREDSRHNMYVHGCTEVEVRTPQEAMEVLLKGQNRRKVAQTRLNWESSRSHSVFTIRVVQAPLDENGEEVVTEKNAVTVSQPSIVDLAGSERTSRTGATGERLKESGSINNSLMCLRQCIEILKENQVNGSNRKVPYRDSKITHFFKNYFEGEGSVKMIVCVNPQSDYYDETLPVMKFAELASEVQIHRPTNAQNDFGFTPGRRRANLIIKEEQKRASVECCCVFGSPSIEAIKAFDFALPSSNLSPEKFICYFTEVNMTRRVPLKVEHDQAFNTNVLNFKRSLNELLKEEVYSKSQLNSYKSNWESVSKKLRTSDNKLHHAQVSLDSHKRKYDTLLDDYKKVCDENEMLKSQGWIERQRLRSRARAKIESQREKIQQEAQSKLDEQREQLKQGSSGDILITVGGRTKVVVQEAPKTPSMNRNPTF